MEQRGGRSLCGDYNEGEVERHGGRFLPSKNQIQPAAETIPPAIRAFRRT